ncbi:MAG: LamG-like jellyroll fold domain-containing protein, partial [Lentisphaerota bacterium]
LVLNMDRPRAIKAVFERDMVAVNARAGEHGLIRPAGEISVERNGELALVAEADKGYYISQLLVDGHPLGSFGPGSNRLSYAFSSVTNYRTIEVSFAANQYNLTIASQSLSVQPAPGRYAFKEGEEVTASATSPAAGLKQGERLVCLGWKGNGAVPSQGSGLSVTFALSRDSSLEWIWRREYELQTSADSGGRVEKPGGAWFGEGKTIVLKAVPEAGYRFAGWSGLEPGEDTADGQAALVMNKPKTVKARFVPDLLNLTSKAGEHGTIEPSGKIRAQKNASQSFLIQAEKNYHIEQLLVDGLPAGSFGQGSNRCEWVLAPLEKEHSIEAFFALDQYSLDVVSDQPDVNPAPGRHVFDAGEEVKVTAEPVSNEQRTPGVRFMCRGWKGQGDVPESGAKNLLSFRLGKDSTITWLWEPEYQLSLETTGAGGRIDGHPGWYRDGTVVVLSAVPESKNVFVQWSGDVAGEEAAQNPLSVSMSQPRGLKAIFAREQGQLAIRVNPERAAWSVTDSPADYAGPRKGVGGLSASPAPAGAYTLQYEPVEGYKTPEKQTLNVRPGSSVEFVGTYEPVPGLMVSVDSIERNIAAGQGASNETFEVWNSGPGELKYAISRNVSWLWITPKVGSSTGEHHDIRVDFDVTHLTPGDYEGRITVAVRNAGTLPREIPVAIRVTQEAAEAPAEESVVTAQDDGQEGLRKGLVAYYSFDGSTKDGSVNNNHGVAHGALSYLNHPPFGQAGVFDQRGSLYVEIPHRDSLVLSHSFTIQFWYKSGAHNGRIIQKLWPAQRSDMREWEISLRDDSKMVFKYTYPGNAAAFEFLCPMDCGWAQGAWNHFVYAYSAPDNRMEGFLNGMSVTNQTPQQPLTPLDTTLPLHVMHDRYTTDPDVRFDAEGSLDELAIWNRRLSSDEIQQLYVDGMGK